MNDAENRRPTIIICGGRDLTDKTLVWDTLDRLCGHLKNPCFVVGGCKTGADKLAEDWFFRKMKGYLIFHADWDKGKSAGPVRNTEMVEYADAHRPAACVAFWDGVSAGTRDTIDKCKKAGIDVRVISYGDRDEQPRRKVQAKAGRGRRPAGRR